MRIPRIYHPESLEYQTQCQLSEDAANHVGRVLRMVEGEQLELFDGSNHIYPAIITESNKKSVKVNILGRELSDKESNLKIHLACEQCGRNVVPEIRPLMKLQDWCAEDDGAIKLNLHPRAQHSIKTLPMIPKDGVRLLIGSEGGLSEQEIVQTQQKGFTEILLGKRVLRTETASLAAISALQIYFGDLGE